MNAVLKKILGFATDVEPAVQAAATVAAGPFAPLVGFVGSLVLSVEKKLTKEPAAPPMTVVVDNQNGGVAGPVVNAPASPIASFVNAPASPAASSVAGRDLITESLTLAMPLIEALFNAHGSAIPDESAFLTAADALVESAVSTMKAVEGIAATVTTAVLPIAGVKA